MRLTNEICVSFLTGSGWMQNHDKELIQKTRKDVMGAADYNAQEQMILADLLSAVPDYSELLHKWVAFRQEGMQQVLHGRIVKTRPGGLLYVRCKNAATRFVEVKDVLKIFDNKIDCYEYKEDNV